LPKTASHYKADERQQCICWYCILEIFRKLEVVSTQLIRSSLFLITFWSLWQACWTTFWFQIGICRTSDADSWQKKSVKCSNRNSK